jgi:integrase
VGDGIQVLIGRTKTGTGTRSIIALDSALVAILREHWRRQAEQRLLLGAGWQDHDLVFPNPYGASQYPETVSRTFTEHVAKLGLPAIRLHDLRHTWASVALASGVHVKVVQERLGHSTSLITLDTYSHVLPALHDEAASTVSNLLRGCAVDGR